MLDEAKVRAVLQKVRAIEVRTRKVMNEGISGSWRSHFKLNLTAPSSRCFAKIGN